MAIDIKTLGLSVDTSGIERGLSKLDGKRSPKYWKT